MPKKSVTWSECEDWDVLRSVLHEDQKNSSDVDCSWYRVWQECLAMMYQEIVGNYCIFGVNLGCKRVESTSYA